MFSCMMDLTNLSMKHALIETFPLPYLLFLRYREREIFFTIHVFFGGRFPYSAACGEL